MKQLLSHTNVTHIFDMEALQNFVAHRCNARFCPTPCHVALGTATFLCWVRSMRLTNFPDRIRISSTIYLETFSAQRRGVRICTCLLYHPMTQKSSFCHRSLRNVVADVLDPIEKRLHDDVVLSRSCISRPSDLSSASDVHRATPLVRLAFPSSHWKRPRRPLPRREETLHEGRKDPTRRRLSFLSIEIASLDLPNQGEMSSPRPFCDSLSREASTVRKESMKSKGIAMRGWIVALLWHALACGRGAAGDPTTMLHVVLAPEGRRARKSPC